MRTDKYKQFVCASKQVSKWEYFYGANKPTVTMRRGQLIINRTFFSRQ